MKDKLVELLIIVIIAKLNIEFVNFDGMTSKPDLIIIGTIHSNCHLRQVVDDINRDLILRTETNRKNVQAGGKSAKSMISQKNRIPAWERASLLQFLAQ